MVRADYKIVGPNQKLGSWVCAQLAAMSGQLARISAQFRRIAAFLAQRPGMNYMAHAVWLNKERAAAGLGIEFG